MRHLIVLFLSSVMFLTCSHEKLTEPVLSPVDAAAGVKSKIYYYPNIDSGQVINIEDFEYDNQKKLIKKNYYGNNREMIYHYEVFNYNNDGILIYKLNYHNNINSPTGFILLDSTVYLYSANLLVEEKITYPLAYYFNRYNYEYAGKYLIKKTKYYNDELDSYITYEYMKGKLQKEINYNKGNSITESKEYFYNGNKLIEIVFYTFSNKAKRKISYTYNKAGKIEIEKVDELFPFSSSLPYVVKYEY